MKCFRKLVQISVIMGLVICLSNMTVMAQDVTTYVTVQQENDIETYASVPDGYVFWVRLIALLIHIVLE